ncbi:E3 ubiquitin-protein ligase HUWE1 [Nematocida parisii]|nr:E3 ubiquitin-protein ligase HUWE1 [Nematocida parisii]KAI5141567.1 E3 ubiquitin-protein ligase HUWE1 [Nematocida parisii]
MKIERPMERRFSQPGKQISNIIKQLSNLPEEELPTYLNNIYEWRCAKTDLLYWVDVLDRFDEILKAVVTEYGLGQFQNKPMKESDKEMVYAILKFQKLLVENSSNKSMFSSFDVVEPFIYSFELDLAIEALYLVSFFASKIHIQRSIKTSMALMKMETLKILIERVKEKPQSMYTYYDETTNNCKRVSIKKAVKKGIYSISDKMLPSQEMRRFIHAIRLHEMAEQHEKLKIIRMLAFSALVYYSYTDLPIDSEFISRDLPETLAIINTESYQMREAAVTMIDAIFRMRIRHSAVIAAMNAQSHEGMIMNLLKKVVNEDVPEHFAIVFFNFLSSCFASGPCVSALFSAGIVQYVCNTLRDRPDISYRKRMRLVMGANTFLFTLPAPFTWFISENGIRILSKELLLAVDVAVGNIKDHDLLMYINSIMKIISQLFKNAGTAEAMRGFLEGEFPRAISLILFHSEEFTPSILAYLFSAVGDYIHNEPSNLPFIIEAGIFDGFVMCMKKELPESPDFLLELPNLIEAFFLNSELIKKIDEENILDRIFESFEIVNLSNIILMYDIGRAYGIFLENLVRHYPIISLTVKEKIYNTMKNLESMIPNTDLELMRLLLGNLFRMMHRAVYRKTTNNQLITDKGLLNNRIISMLMLIEIPTETELYTDVMNILMEVFDEDQTYVISYIAKVIDRVMKNKVTLENIEKIKRILLIVNYLIFKNEETCEEFIKHCTSKGFLQIVKRISQYFDNLKKDTALVSVAKNESLTNLYYSFTMGILKTVYRYSKTNAKEYLKIFGLLVEDLLSKTEQIDHLYYTQRMHGLKNYIMVDKSPQQYPQKNEFVVTQEYLMGINLSETLMEHAKNSVSMLKSEKITMDAHKKVVSSILEVLSIYVRGIKNLFVPVKEPKKKVCEIEEHVLIIAELLMDYIDKSSIEHLLNIVKTAFFVTLRKQITKEVDRENEGSAEYKRRNILGSFFISVFLNLPKEETEAVLKSDIFTILVKNKKTFKQVYNKNCFGLLQYAAIKESRVFSHLVSFIPKMTKQVGASTDPAFLKLYAVGLVFVAIRDTLKKTTVLSRFIGNVVFAESTCPMVVEAQGIVILAIVKLKIEYNLAITIEDPIIHLNRIYAIVETAEQKESLVILANLLIRRVIESKEAAKEAVDTIIKNKHLGKSRMYTVHTVCSNLRNALFYSITSFLEYLSSNFECISAGWEDIRHKLPDEPANPTESGQISEAVLETLSDGLFTKQIKIYSGLNAELFRTLFVHRATGKMEQIVRIHSLCLLVVSFPQLISTLVLEDYSFFMYFLENHAAYSKSLKPSAFQQEDKTLAYWSGHFIMLIFNHTTYVEVKKYILEKVLELLPTSINATVIFSELIQEILTMRFSKNTFDENTALVKEMNCLEVMIRSTMQIDNRRKDYGSIMEILTKPMEYITRILAVDEKEAFYEEVTQSEEEVYFEDIDEGYMEDFDTDETMDSDQVVYDDTEENSQEVGELCSEDSLTVYTAESNNYGEYLMSDEESSSEEEGMDEEQFSSEQSEKNEFLKSLCILPISKLIGKEMEIFNADERMPFVQKILEGIIISNLQEKEPSSTDEETFDSEEGSYRRHQYLMRREEENDEEELNDYAIDPTDPDAHLDDEGPEEIDEGVDEYDDESQYDYDGNGSDDEEYDDEESFATGEEIAIGDENGEIPELDVEVLNNLPSSILEDTVENFYQDRISSSTEYRAISLHFLNRLREEVRSVFEEHEARYMETFAGEIVPRREEKKKKPQEMPFIAEREAAASVPIDIVFGLIHMVLQCGNRRNLYRIIHNISANKEVRIFSVETLVNSIHQAMVEGASSSAGAGSSTVNASAGSSGNNEAIAPEVITKRGFEALTYLCTKSSDFTTVFSYNTELINKILQATNKRTIAESVKLLSTVGDCFNNDKVSEPENIEVRKYIGFLEYDMTDDTFKHFCEFIKKTDRFYRPMYLLYLMGGSKKSLEECLDKKAEFNSHTHHKGIIKLVRMLSLVNIMGITETYLDSLMELREMPFWEYYFNIILPKEKESLYASSILPLFKAFVIVHTIQMYIGRNENVNEFSEIPNSDSSIYYNVVEKEKDLINTFIQADPDLLFHAFAGLQKKILDFDNKRIYFYKKIREDVQLRPTISLMVQRGAVFEDTFHQLMRLNGEQVRNAKFNIKFAGEEGVDAGGLTREWYSELSKEMFNANYALFTPIGSSYQPNHISHINPEHLVYFKFIGRIIGKAVYDEMTVDCHFTRAFYKRVLSIPVDLTDVEALDPEFHRSLVWILENDIENVLEMTFSLEQDRFGITEVIDLKENGRNIAVTNENKREYVELVCRFKLVRVIERQLSAFAEGFFEILDVDMLRMFNEKELELLISGLPEIDVDDWRNNTIYFGYTSDSQVIRWYWRAVRNFSMEERAKLLQFATGTSKLPLEGFAGLRCQNGNQKFQIHKASGGSSRLPTAHTCFNQLDLPEYDSYEQLVKALLFSLEECTSGFGFA